MIRMIFLAILTEALVELFFKAAPLQGLRHRLIFWTPFLDTKAQGHLLTCKYCVSVWMGAVVYLFWLYVNWPALQIAGAALIVARASNYTHTLIGLVRDAQINKRLERK